MAGLLFGDSGLYMSGCMTFLDVCLVYACLWVWLYDVSGCVFGLYMFVGLAV